LTARISAARNAAWLARSPRKGFVVSISALLIFAGVYFVAVATPGPGIAALVARVLGCGLKGVGPFIAGFAVGDLFWLAVAATGLAVVAHEFATLFVALKFAGAAYLLYVAWGLVRAPAAVDLEAPPDRVATGWRAFLGGFSLTLGNPKVIVFFLSIMPLVVDLDAIDAVSFAEMAATCMAVITATLGAYALAANRARRWFRSSRAMTAVRRATAGVMAGAAVAIVTR
jgi:threonine/homoserine/homoserine lactone efflux protein